MNLLLISRDVKVLDEMSSVFQRMKDYSRLFDELHIIVVGKSHNINDFGSIRKYNNLFIYNKTSTNKILSFIKTLFFCGKIGKKIKTSDSFVSSQDPFESGIIAFVCSKVTGLKFQIQVHTDCFSPLYSNHTIFNFLRSIVAKVFIKQANSVRVVSNRIKQSILDLKLIPASKIYIVPIFIDTQAIKDSPITINLKSKYESFTKIVLIVARLEKEKNLELSLSAFHKMLRFDPSLGLVIAGSGTQEVWLKTIVKHLNIEKNVVFLGWVNDSSSLFKTSNVLLVTSLYEGYGMNIVESLVCGTPVVSTDVGIAKQAGAILVKYDAGEIALRTIEILKENIKGILNDGIITGKDENMNLLRKSFF